MMQPPSNRWLGSKIGKAAGVAAAALFCAAAFGPPSALAAEHGHGPSRSAEIATVGSAISGHPTASFHGGGAARDGFHGSWHGGGADRDHDWDRGHGWGWGGVGFGVHPGVYGYYLYDYAYSPPPTAYYCPDPAGYYPYVSQCYTGWQLVPAG